jgi:Dullard-like phosphatase family protein
MNSIQFITNQVDRVIRTPPATPKRSLSTTSIYDEHLAAAVSAATEKLDSIPDTSTPSSSSSSSLSAKSFSDSLPLSSEKTPKHYPNTGLEPHVSNTPDKDSASQQHPPKEHILISILLFFPRLIVFPFVWIYSIVFKKDAVAYSSIFRSFYHSLPTDSDAAAHGLSKSSAENAIGILEDARRVRSPYTSLPNNNSATGHHIIPLPTRAGAPRRKVKLPIAYALRYPRSLAPPRPLLKPSKKTLVLDLDETLIHSLSRSPTGFSQGHMVEVKLGNNSFATLYNVLKRPHCDKFLETVSQWYNLVVFTASIQEYADPMIDWLEKDRKYFCQRFYRQHCKFYNSNNGNTSIDRSSVVGDSYGYVKDLATVESDLSKVLIIDNSAVSYLNHETNAISIEGWINDPSDTSLLSIIPLLSALRFATDVRTFLGMKAGESMFA